MGDEATRSSAGRPSEPAAMPTTLPGLLQPPSRATTQASGWTENDCPALPASEGAPLSFGPYQLLREIARGGMGVVYLAHDPRAGRQIALKMILQARVARQIDRDRFLDEARAAAQLDHPHIVPIYEVGQVGDTPYFTMRLMEGGSLADRKRQYSLPRRVNSVSSRSADRVSVTGRQRAAAALLASIADGVHAAHRQGVLHRDLKPGNVLFDGDDRPAIADFGLAKRLDDDDHRTLAGNVVGTPAFMSPEQAASTRGLTVASDVYSLGAMLFDVLTGRPPIVASPVAALFERLRRGDVDRPAQLVLGLDPALEAICLKALRLDPAERYADAAELAADLRAFQVGDPVSATRPSTYRLAHAWARRHPRMAVGLAVGTAGLVGVISVLTVATVRIDAALQEAVAARALADASAAEAKSQRDRAAAQSQRAQETLETFTALLESATPRVAGRPVTVADAIRQAADTLDGRPTDPQIAWPLRQTLAGLSRSLGEPRLAMRHAEAALAALRAVEGTTPTPELAYALSDLAVMSFGLGELDPARRHAQDAATLLERLDLPPSRDVAVVMGNLGVILGHVGQRQAGLELSQRVVAMLRAVQPGDSVELAGALHNLALAQDGLDDDQAALANEEAALAMRRRVSPDDALSIAESLVTLGSLCLERRDLPRAVDATGQAVDLLRGALEGDHPQLAEALVNHALALEAMGRREQGLVSAEQALGMAKRLNPGDHALTVDAWRVYASLLPADGVEDQVGLLEQASAMGRRLTVQGCPQLALTLNHWAVALAKAGRVAEAQVALADCLAATRATRPAGHGEIGRAAHNLGLTLQELGRAKEAEPLFRESLAIAQQQRPAEPHVVAVRLGHLALNLASQDQLDEATTVAEAGLRLCRELQPDRRGQLASALIQVTTYRRLRGLGHTACAPLLHEAQAWAIGLGYPPDSTLCLALSREWSLQGP